MDSEDFIGPVNLGNPHEVTVMQLAQKVLELTNSDSTIVNKPLPQDDPTRRKPDISLAKQKLNWEPEISFEDGLNRTIKEFSSRL